MEKTTEHPGPKVDGCGSIRCKFNVELKCTAETISVSGAGECSRETWGVK
jgi:hypothetical protein